MLPFTRYVSDTFTHEGITLEIMDRPVVTVVGYSTVHDDAFELVPRHDSEAEVLCAIGSKVCYDAHGTDGRSVASNIQRCVDQEHFSVLEHASVSLLITGISRGLSHEQVRHRHASYSQRSTRYVDESTASVVLDPMMVKMRDEKPTVYERMLRDIAMQFECYRNATDTFMLMLPHDMSAVDKRKKARESSRQLLPHALETAMVITANMRTWREMLLLRTGAGAAEEIRRLYTEVWRVLGHMDQYHNILGDIMQVDVEDSPYPALVVAKQL